jgi:catechol 2,3-dioxygenase-like lactoylglutathione lyase family enzyme
VNDANQSAMTLGRHLIAPTLLRVTLVCLAGVLAVSASAAAQSDFVNVLDHLSLAAPDQAKAIAWYQKHFGGEAMAEGPDRLMFGQTRLVIQRGQMARPSAGSAFDHIGFSVADLDDTLKQLAADGATITAPARDVPNLFRIGFVDDPWGVRLEIVQDPQKPGLHHLHVRGPDPAATLNWYRERFGGRVEKLRGQIDGIQYGDIWVLAQQGDAVPTAGRAIDHIGMRTTNVDDAIAAFKAKNVKVTTEPRAITVGGTPVRVAFIEGLDGARIEIVQR